MLGALASLRTPFSITHAVAPLITTSVMDRQQEAGAHTISRLIGALARLCGTHLPDVTAAAISGTGGGGRSSRGNELAVSEPSDIKQVVQSIYLSTHDSPRGSHPSTEP
jgi:hypothetical protein